MKYGNQITSMRWILFFIFVFLFTVIVIFTIMSVFFGFFYLPENQKELLFKAFIIEIGAAVISLFYSVFEIRRKPTNPKIRLDFGIADIKSFIGGKATITPICDGKYLPDIVSPILNDNGPYCNIQIPQKAESITITTKKNNKSYFGSFPTNTYIVEMVEEENI